MKSDLLLKQSLLVILSSVLTFGLYSKSETDEEMEPEYFAELDPITVHGKSVEDAGFAFIVKFRYKVPFSGIKVLVVTRVGADSPAAKAGIEKGARIIRIRETDVDGLSIKRLQKVLTEKSKEGIPLTIIPKGSKEELQVMLELEIEKTKKQKKAEAKKTK